MVLFPPGDLCRLWQRMGLVLHRHSRGVLQPQGAPDQNRPYINGMETFLIESCYLNFPSLCSPNLLITKVCALHDLGQDFIKDGLTRGQFLQLWQSHLQHRLRPLCNAFTQHQDPLSSMTSHQNSSRSNFGHWKDLGSDCLQLI